MASPDVGISLKFMSTPDAIAGPSPVAGPLFNSFSHISVLDQAINSFAEQLFEPSAWSSQSSALSREPSALSSEPSALSSERSPFCSSGKTCWELKWPRKAVLRIQVARFVVQANRFGKSSGPSRNIFWEFEWSRKVVLGFQVARSIV